MKFLAVSGFTSLILTILRADFPDMEVLFVYKPYIEERQKAPDMAGPFFLLLYCFLIKLCCRIY